MVWQGQRVTDYSRDVVARMGESSDTLRSMMQQTPGLMESLETALGLQERGVGLTAQAGLAQAGAMRSVLASDRANQFRAGLLNTRPGAGQDSFLKAAIAGQQAHASQSQLGLGFIQQGLSGALEATSQLSPSPLFQSYMQGMFGLENQRLAAYSSIKGAKAQSKGSMVSGIAGAVGTAIAFCWVARAVFGESNPKWVQCRHWILNHAPSWFRKFYTKHGEAIGKVVERSKILKLALRPAFEIMAWKGRQAMRRLTSLA